MTNKPKKPEGKRSQSSSGRSLHAIVEELCRPESYGPLIHKDAHDMPMPSVEALSEIVENLRAVLFPGYFGASEINAPTMHYYVGSSLDRTEQLLSDQIRRGFCFNCDTDTYPACSECGEKADSLALRFLSELPGIRRLLATDVRAAYVGDPAAKSPGETVFCYPSIQALTNYRIAHELYRLEIPIIPRIITEMAHSITGIDIHPGATIGEHFFMDHGTGIVIGETCRIGRNVRIYQGVTLGARSFPLDDSGKPIKGIERHPIVEDDVIIYSGATILGRVTIGKGSVIGGNVWITKDIPSGSRIVQSRYQDHLFENGSGI